MYLSGNKRRLRALGGGGLCGTGLSSSKRHEQLIKQGHLDSEGWRDRFLRGGAWAVATAPKPQTPPRMIDAHSGAYQKCLDAPRCVLQWSHVLVFGANTATITTWNGEDRTPQRVAAQDHEWLGAVAGWPQQLRVVAAGCHTCKGGYILTPRWYGQRFKVGTCNHDHHPAERRP
jgi:hypothetical protein